MNKISRIVLAQYSNLMKKNVIVLNKILSTSHAAGLILNKTTEESVTILNQYDLNIMPIFIYHNNILQ